jgi:hypothetical protein
MNDWTALGLITLAAGMAVGCNDGSPGTETEAHSANGSQLQTAEESALLAFVNDQGAATMDVLDFDCALRSDAAGNIVAHRDGGAGAADDDLFNDVAELDAVPRVGDKTLAALTTCAQSMGYLPTVEQLALLNFLNDAATTFERLDDDCGLRSDGAGNLIAHRDGGDGITGTADDDPFHSEAEVDGVSRVGEATLALLHSCATTFGYGAQSWDPTPVSCTFTNVDPNLTVSQQTNGIIAVDHGAASQGAAMTIGFDGLQLNIAKGSSHMGAYKVNRLVPEGYGGAFIDNELSIERFLITRDPAGTLTTTEALVVARQGLTAYVRDVRSQQPDWVIDLGIPSWEDAIALGVMDGIQGFGDPTYDSSTQTLRNANDYLFAGAGPFMLYTEVVVSKSTGEPIDFYVEID